MTNIERLIELAAVEGLDAGIGVPLWERQGNGWVLCAKRDPSKADYRSYGPEFDQPGDNRKWAFRVPGLLPHADPAEALRLVHLWRCGRVPGRLPCGSEGDVTDPSTGPEAEPPQCARDPGRVGSDRGECADHDRPRRPPAK